MVIIKSFYFYKIKTCYLIYTNNNNLFLLEIISFSLGQLIIMINMSDPLKIILNDFYSII